MILIPKKVITRLWEPLKDNRLLANLWEQVKKKIIRKMITCHNVKKTIKKFRENQVLIKFFLVITESNNSKSSQYLPNTDIN